MSARPGCIDLAFDGREPRIENRVGAVSLPLGLAGPLRLRGEHAHGDYLVPLATTEAALVASFTRGARVITESGGCTAAVLAEGVGRSPGFVFHSVRDAVAFARWIPSRLALLSDAASSTTRHGRLTSAQAHVEGNHAYLDLEFATGEAAGQNMATFAAAAIVACIERECPVKPRRTYIEANHSGDKKATRRSLDGVRGRRVSAEVRVPARVLHSRLRVSAQDMAGYWRLGAIGGVLAGAVGIQGHYANGLAALYIACGQDAACVAESAVGVTRMEAEGDTLYAAVTLPNVIAGTVGGGTTAPSARASLERLAACGPCDARALAEVCAGLALAGEISIIAAICSNDFARAHAVLARGRRREPHA